ncbi:MAG: D-glycero-beta-D-manno-heptose-7-phosphate kinase [Rhodovibrionaceae bacterium]
MNGDAPALSLGDIEALRGRRVVVVGDVMLDRYYYGTVERISPEGPIPVHRTERETVSLGGAGNVARNLAGLGVEATLLSLAGDDDAGEELSGLLQGLSPQSRILRDPARVTTVKRRYLAAGQQLFRSDTEMARPLSAESAAELSAALHDAIAEADAVVLSDYAKGVLSPAVLGAAIEAARARHLPLVADPKGADFSRYRGADFLTPNRGELAAASGLPAGSLAEVAAACRELIAAQELQGVLATLGAAGMLLAELGQEPRFLPAIAQEVFDVSGAGDTVAAVFAAGLAAGQAPLRAAELANLAAGVVVRKLGTATVSPGELLHMLHGARLEAAEAKIYDLPALDARAAEWRAAGLTIGFTNGCFDLLHPGHLSLLRQARAACDRLVVGLNSDASVQRLKGAGRPVQEEAARAAVLASLSDVNAVAIFDQDTPLELLRRLRPDVLVKGADYSRNEVVGGDLVEGYGGRVVLAELLPGHSTSSTVNKLSSK